MARIPEELTAEVRNILSGLVANREGYVIEARDIFELSYQGMYAGTLNARLFGLTVRKRRYRTEGLKLDEIPTVCEKAMYLLGMPAYVRNLPEEAAVLMFPPMRKPGLLTAAIAGEGKNKGRELILTFYSARTLFSLLNAANRFRAWEKRMPEGSVVRVYDDERSAPVHSGGKSGKKRKK